MLILSCIPIKHWFRRNVRAFRVCFKYGGQVFTQEVVATSRARAIDRVHDFDHLSFSARD